MESMYMSWPGLIKDALDKWSMFGIEKGFNKITIAGMGGSGIVGDYIATLAITNNNYKYPVYVVKSHVIPGFVDSETLFIAVSYSGNTVETLKATGQAIKRGAYVVTVSSGGLLKKYFADKGALHIDLPEGLAPRAALPVMLYRILGLLDTSGYTLVDKKTAESSLVFLNKDLESIYKISEEMATWIYREHRELVIATHVPLESLATRGKNEFNENSKTLVKLDIAPEWMHNDIVGYEKPFTRDHCVLEIVDPDDKVGVQLVEFMDEIYRDLGLSTYRLALRGSNLLEKLIYGTLIIGLASVKLARLRGIDPLETRNISRYKSIAHKVFN
ncbi:MAG: bifunctional phosphoglucose/phosphomannose isomerase [Desulfurococcaceae archaeon]